MKMSEGDYLKLTIPRVDDQPAYMGIGKVFRVMFKPNTQMDVEVDINLFPEVTD